MRDNYNTTIIESIDDLSYYLGWGNNSFGQLGLGENAQAFYNTPQILLVLDNSIQGISQKSITYYNTAYVLENYNPSTGESFQEVYIAGNDEFGQYGNGTLDVDLPITQSPTLVAIIIPHSSLNLQKVDRSLIINEPTSNNNSFKYTFEFIEMESDFYF